MKGWRTILWNAANAIVPVMEATEMRYAIPEDWQPYWLMIFIAGNFVLRYKTTTPIGVKE